MSGHWVENHIPIELMELNEDTPIIAGRYVGDEAIAYLAAHPEKPILATTVVKEGEPTNTWTEIELPFDAPVDAMHWFSFDRIYLSISGNIYWGGYDSFGWKQIYIGHPDNRITGFRRGFGLNDQELWAWGQNSTILVEIPDHRGTFITMPGITRGHITAFNVYDIEIWAAVANRIYVTKRKHPLTMDHWDCHFDGWRLHSTVEKADIITAIIRPYYSQMRAFTEDRIFLWKEEDGHS